jgi:hypothetical protein
MTSWLNRRMHPLSGTSLSDGTVAASAALILLAMPLFNFLTYHRYPIFSAEVVIILVVLLGSALVFGALYQIAPLLGRAALEPMLLVTVLITFTMRGSVLALMALVPVFVLVARRSVLPFAGVGALIATFAGLAGISQGRAPPLVHSWHAPAAAISAADRRLPTLVHIILDEQAGVESLPNVPGAASVAKSLESFYVSHGFRLFGRAHSEYFFTQVSIPGILSFDSGPPSAASESNHSRYFDVLRRRGYVVHVVQSSFLDYCRKNHVASCTTYEPGNIHVIRNSSLPAIARARLILLAYSKLGGVYRRLHRRNVPMPEMNFDVDGSPLPLIVPTAARIVYEQLRGAQPGHAYFVHLLLPHYPAARRADCSLKPVAEWRRNDLGSMNKRQRAYLDQVSCTLRVIAADYAAVSAATGGDFIMIVHGDHGSRLVDRLAVLSTAGLFNDGDLINAFGTLFAVRAPRIPDGYDRSPCAVSALLAAVARSELAQDGRFQPSCPPPAGRFGSYDWRMVQSKALPKSWISD